MRKICLLFCLFTWEIFGQIVDPIFFSGPNNPPFVIKNQKTVFSSGPNTTLALPAFSNPLTSGSIILVGTENATIATNVASITDTAGNTYTTLRRNQWTPGTATYFCASNTSTASSNILTFTAAVVATTFINAIEITNISGAISCASVNSQQGNSSSATGSTTITIANLTPTTNGDFIWGMIFTFACSNPVTPGVTPGVGFTGIQTALTDFDLAEYYIQPVAKLITVTANCSSTGMPFDSFAVAISP